MAKLFDDLGPLPEQVTEILDDDRWWAALRRLANLLRDAGVARICIEYGIVASRDDAGLPQGADREIDLTALEDVVRRGLADGTIERAGMSDFLVRAGNTATVMLCNDADIHVGSRDPGFLRRVSESLTQMGVKVFGPS